MATSLRVHSEPHRVKIWRRLTEYKLQIGLSRLYIAMCTKFSETTPFGRQRFTKQTWVGGEQWFTKSLEFFML